MDKKSFITLGLEVKKNVLCTKKIFEKIMLSITCFFDQRWAKNNLANVIKLPGV
jgi:hypothetical protein